MVPLDQIKRAVEQAIAKSPPRRFHQSLDLAINLTGLDMRKPENRFDAEILLPHGLGSPRKIAIFARGELALKARNLGVDLIPPEKLEDFTKKDGRKLAQKYDFLLAEGPLMPIIGKKLGAVLGPRGKMPRPVSPGANLEELVSRLSRSIRIRTKENLCMHTKVGDIKMDPQQVAENILEILNRVLAKYQKHQLASVYLKTTMGPSVRIL